jgi:competence protein ComEC
MIRTLAPIAVALTLAATLALTTAACTRAGRPLDIYFIDVEGGQSTLLVTPAGESLLVDTGFPGPGGFDAVPGDPAKARDANRIAAAARDAGIARIDYLLVTHFHADHDGGVPELAQLLPIRTFIDHGGVNDDAEAHVAGTVKALERYAAVREGAQHLQPAPGTRLPLAGVEVTIVSAAELTIGAPLEGAGSATAGCAPTAPPAQEPTENPRSTGFQLRYGRFRVLDVGDLTGAPLYALACPRALVGPADVYVVAHHGGDDAASPATFAAFRPRVAVVNNGARKGGGAAMLTTLHGLTGVDTWQLHKSENAGAQNTDEAHIANLDESAAHWIKISARDDGSFTVTNARTGATQRYAAR